jgi:hypothetical protein
MLKNIVARLHTSDGNPITMVDSCIRNIPGGHWSIPVVLVLIIILGGADPAVLVVCLRHSLKKPLRYTYLSAASCGTVGHSSTRRTTSTRINHHLERDRLSGDCQDVLSTSTQSNAVFYWILGHGGNRHIPTLSFHITGIAVSSPFIVHL